MESIGEYLKNQRESKGTSLQEIAKATHIGLRFLEAIEREDFKELPGEIFVKGFIRTYAEYIDLDPQEIMERCKERFEKKDAPGGGKIAEKDLKIRPHPEAFHGKANKVLPGIIGFLILLGMIYYLSDFVTVNDKGPAEMHESKPEMAPLPTRDLPISPVEKEGEITPAESAGEILNKGEGTSALSTGPQRISAEVRPAELAQSATRETPKTSQEKSGTETPVAPSARQGSVSKKPGSSALEGLTLKLTAVADSWMKVKIDNSETRRDFILKGGETVAIKGENEFSITTGNASAVKITLNGEKVPWPSKDNVIYDFVITAPGVERAGQESASPPAL